MTFGCHTKMYGTASCGKNAEIRHICIQIIFYSRVPSFRVNSEGFPWNDINGEFRYKHRFGPNWIWHNFLPRLSLRFELLNVKGSHVSDLILPLPKSVNLSINSHWVSSSTFHQWLIDISAKPLWQFSNFSKWPDLLKLLKCQWVIAEIAENAEIAEF